MKVIPASLLDLFPLAAGIPLLSPPHPVNFCAASAQFGIINFADLASLQLDMIHIEPWSPDDTSIPQLLYNVIASIKSRSADQSLICFIAYIWATPETQVFLSHDARLLQRTWPAFCEIIHSGFPNRLRVPNTSVVLYLQPFIEFIQDHIDTPEDASRIAFFLYHAFRIAGTLEHVPLRAHPPPDQHGIHAADFALLRDGFESQHRVYANLQDAQSAHLNATIRIFRSFGPAGPDNIGHHSIAALRNICDAYFPIAHALADIEDLYDGLAQLHTHALQFPTLGLPPPIPVIDLTIDD